MEVPTGGGRAWAEWSPFRWHLAIFAAAAAILFAVRWFWVGGGWYFWLILVWLAGLGIHYLVVKSLNVNDDWADERAADLRARSYDLKHVSQVVDSAVDGDPDEDPAAPRRL